MKVLLEHTGIKPEDIVCTKWSSGHFYPGIINSNAHGLWVTGHYVVLDHSTKAIVVAIRGTFHVKDCLTDLIASYEPFLVFSQNFLRIIFRGDMHIQGY
jgi:hypothetical protein